jgi:hypothetical protein
MLAQNLAEYPRGHHFSMGPEDFRHSSRQHLLNVPVFKEPNGFLFFRAKTTLGRSKCNNAFHS